MKSKRNLILIATTLGFLITAPLVTLYTAGFRYHWKKQQFERVGFFETSTVPTGAEVVIDGKVHGKTPFVDMNILPGNYTLVLTKPGYRDFSTTFEVRSGLSTLILDTLLWKNAEANYVAGASSDAVFNTSGGSLAWMEPIPGALAALTSLTSGENKKLGCVLKSGEAKTPVWNQNGTAVLFTVKTSGGLDGCVATLSGNSYSFSDIMPPGAMTVDWSPFDDSHLLVRTISSDLVLAYERKDSKVVSTKSVPFTIRGSKLFGIRPIAGGMELYSQSLGTLSIPFGSDKATLPAGDYTFLPSPEAYLVVRESRHGRIDVFKTSSFERLATVVAERLLFESGSKSERFLAVGTHEISLYNIEEGTSRLILRHSEAITKAVWHPLGQHLIAHIGNAVFTIPFEKSSEATVTLTAMDAVRDMWVDKRGDTLLLLGTRGDKTGVWELGLKD